MILRGTLLLDRKLRRLARGWGGAPFLFLAFVVLGGSVAVALAFTTSLPSSVIVALTVWVIAALVTMACIVALASKYIRRIRRVGNNWMDGEVYMESLAALKKRKVPNPKHFIETEFEHSFLSSHIWRFCIDREFLDPAQIASLVYVVDKDPEETTAYIRHMIGELGMRDAKSMRGMLLARASVSAPLQEGAL